MPPLSSSVVDEKAIGILQAWIAQLPPLQASPQAKPSEP